MSLHYARWKRNTHVSKDSSWNCPSRPREDKSPTTPKVRWYRDLHPLMPNLPRRPQEEPAQCDF